MTPKPIFAAAGVVLLATATLATATLAPSPKVWAQAEMTLGDYKRLVHTYEKVALAKRKPKEPTPADLAKQMRTVKTVRFPNGKTVMVDLSRDADALTDAPAKGKKPLETAGIRAAALSTLVTPSGTRPDASNAQTQAAAILARNEFKIEPEKPDTTPRWMKSVGEWFAKQWRGFWRGVGDWLRRMFPAGSAAPGTLAGLAQFVQFLLYFAVAVGTLIGLYFLALYLSGKKGKTAKKGRSGSTGLDLDLDEFPDPLGYAREVAERGDYREAVRLVYIASLRRLAGGGLVVLQENRTNWEYQRGLRSRSQAAYDLLLPGTRLFDRIWYGRQNATQAEYEQTVALHDSLPDPAVSTPAKTNPTLVAAGSANGESGANSKGGNNTW